MNQSTSKAHAHFGWTTRAWSGVAIVGAVATAALIYAVTELSNAQEPTGAVIHESWLGHWMVIWVSAFAALLALAVPLFSQLVEYSQRNSNEAAFYEMLKVQPNLRQEWMVMGSRDLPEIEKAISRKATVAESLPMGSRDLPELEKAIFLQSTVAESLEPLGGLTVEPALLGFPKSKDSLRRPSFAPYL